jgi:hypothetical protein
MTAFRFERRGGIYAVTFTYDPLVVEVLKLTVPHYPRTWNKPRREWLIEAVYGKPLADVPRRLDCTVIGIDDPPQGRCGDDPVDWVRAVFRRVGPARAPLAYKLLSRVCHPDHGGDHQLQLELNRAYTEIERKSA